MKKRISFIMMVILLVSSSVNVYAAGTTEKIGKVYSTDIVAYVDGIPINSYNIGGKTGIVCEELKDYGFYVNWDGSARKLFVTTAGASADMKFLPGIKTIKEIGKVIGSIYRTDIAAYINGKGIPSYNIGGRTIVLIEDLNEAYGFTKNWNPEKRTISANPYRSGSTINTDIGAAEVLELAPTLSAELFYDVYAYDCLLSLDEKSAPPQNKMLKVNGQEYLPLKNTLDSFGVNYLWDSAANTLKINSLPDKEALINAAGSSNETNTVKTDDAIVKIKVGIENAAMGAVKGNLEPLRTNELPFVYKKTVYFPAEALADCFDVIYKGKGSFVTKKDEPQTWVHDSEYIYMPIDRTDNRLYGWIEYTRPENNDSGRNMVITYPYGKYEPIRIKFARPMDKSSLNQTNIPVVREYSSEKDNTCLYEVISGKYSYSYDERVNELTIATAGAELNKGDYVDIFIRDITDSAGNRLEGSYRFRFCVE